MKHAKRLLSLFLTLAFALCLALPALAAQTGEDLDIPYSESLTEEKEPDETEADSKNEPSFWDKIVKVLLMPFSAIYGLFLGAVTVLPLLGVGFLAWLGNLFSW